jgi:DNA-binding MarR family transcriptional regulator
MPRSDKQNHSTPSPQDEPKIRGGDEFYRLVRYSHIFSSAIREILELKILKEVTPLSLSLSQFHLLKIMSINGQHQVGELAGFLGVSAPAATKNIDKLERLKLVVRTPSKGDRRATLLSVSSKGRRLVQKYEELKAARLSPVLEDFEPEEVEQLSDLLEKFSVSLLKIEQPVEGFCLRCAAYIVDDCSIGLECGGCPYWKGRKATDEKPAEKETQ